MAENVESKPHTVLGVATVENSVEVPQKIKNRVTIGPCNLSSGYPHDKGNF